MKKRPLRSNTKSPPIPLPLPKRQNLEKNSTQTHSAPNLSTGRDTDNSQQQGVSKLNMDDLTKKAGSESPTNTAFMLQIMQTMKDMKDELCKQISDLNETVILYQQEGAQLRESVKETAMGLAAVKEENATLKAEVKKLQQQEASYMITIHGVPKDKPLLDVVRKIGNLLEITVQEHQIADMYRIRTKKIQHTAPIVVKFTSRLFRDLFLERRKNRSVFTSDIGIMGDKLQLYLNEYLTKDVNKLLYEAKILKNQYNFKFVWAKHGNIYAKQNDDKSEKPFKIVNKDIIDQIIENIKQKRICKQ
jgi:hypothetical protein